MALRVYVDTSVLSAALDTRQPERQYMTQQFWKYRHQYELGTSDVCRQEVLQIKDGELRQQVMSLLAGLNIASVTSEAELLAAEYIAGGAFSLAMQQDALHVASAVVNRYDVIVSWNFRHLVNRKRRAAVLAINAQQGYPAIDIVAPPEL